MRYTRSAALAAMALLSASACMSSGGTEPSGTASTQPAQQTQAPAMTEEERQREIERRAALRGERNFDKAVVAPASEGETPPPIVGEVPDAMLAAMKADLATRLGRSADGARVVRAQQVVWPDGSIGCALPGVFYTQQTVVGYLVELDLDSKTYRYHAALKGMPVYCEHPSGHFGTLGTTQ